MKIINTFLFQLIITILSLIRFFKFMDCKNFLFENKDIYYDESHFPNEIFNLEIFPLSICINLFIYNIFYITFQNKISFCKNKEQVDNENNNNNINKTMFFFIILIILNISLLFPFVWFCCFSEDFEINLKNNYDYIIDNWKMNPIKSIKLNSEDYFEIERENDYNYINIFKINKAKICGKDNNGNYLFFPEGKDCPINDIFISSSDLYKPGYTKIELRNNNSLYYTNQNTTGKILIDLWDKSTSYEWSDADEAFSIPFNEFIGSYHSHKFYSVYYIGINISSINEEYAGDKIKNFESNISAYKSLPFVIFIIYLILFLGRLFYAIFMLCPKIKIFYIILFHELLVILSLTSLLIVYLTIDIKYIINFLDKINSDFELLKSQIRIDIIFYLFVLFISLIIFIILIFISYSNPNDLDNDENKDPLIADLSKENITPNFNQISEINENKDNDEKIKIKYIDDNKKEKDNLIIDDNKKEKENLIIDDNKTFENININFDIDDSNKTSFHILSDKNEKDILKDKLPFELKENEKLMCVIFQINEEKEAQYPIICKDKLIFEDLENLLYDKNPEYKETENEFYVDGNKIDKLKTLEENNIKDGQVIIMKIMS